MSPASFSFPSERTPSPLEDYESPKVHLETGEEFTRQGTFADNIVVPTDRCDDPSFFSGLSKSNTPDRIPIALIDEEESEEESEKGGEDVYFEPAIELPRQVEFRSGEEDETVIFEERAKLFRFQDGEWKERGLGALKLLWNNTTGHARILMRREKVLKICANHFLTQDMTLKACKGSDRSWVWNTLADISDDKTKPQQFAAKFQTREIAEKFKTKFEELQQKKALFVPESPAVSPFAANPLATKLNPDHTKVPVLSSNLPYLSSTPNKPAETPSNVGDNQSKEGTPSSNNSRASSKNNGVIDVDNFWNQPQTGIDNIPYFQLNKSLDNGKEPERSQYSYLPSTTSHLQNTFSFSFGSESQAASNEVPENKNASDSKNKDIFGNTTGKGSLSFQDLASNSGTGFAFTPLGANGSGFSGFGKPIFSVPDNDKEEEHDTENEANVDFRPIVSLPPVKNQVTGEEGELTKFSERAKLFRFDPANKEWKERGLGEIKLLYDPSSGKSRVVMRREQVHKLCANHFILPDMKLKATTTSNRSWLWHTHADVSDGEPKAEQLAVKFKQEETASEFKKIFEELQSICPTSKSCDPDADQDTSTNMSVAPSSESTAQRSQMNNDLKVLFQPPAGSWSCDKCMVQNSSQRAQCVACQSPKAGLSQPSQKPLFSFAPSSGFSFGSPTRAVSASSQPNDNTKSHPGFTFASPSFSFGSQTPKDKATDSDTSKPNVSTGFSFDSGKTLPNKFVFGEKKADKPPFVFSLSDSNSDSGQKSAMFTASPFQSTPTFDTKNKENYKDVCVPCQSPKHGTQPAVTDPGFNFGASPGFSFVNDTNKASSAGTGFGFNPSNVDKDVSQKTGFSFGPTDTSEDTGKNSGFSFVNDTNKASSAGTGFGFNPSNVDKDVSQKTGFSFGPTDTSEDSGKNSGFTFVSDANKASSTGTGFGFNPSNVDKNVSQKTGFSFGPTDTSEDTGKNSGFSFGQSVGSKAPGTSFTFGSHNTGTVHSDQSQVPAFSSVSSDESKDVIGKSSPDFGASDSTKAAVNTNNLKLAFQPAEGSWECDTCLVRNNADSNVCAACQTPKPGTKPVVTQTTSSTSKPSGFTFDLKDSAKGSGFAFGATLKETGFSFGYPEASKETTKEPNFSFVPDNATSQPQAQTTDFSFGSNEKDRMNKVPTTGFNFGAVDANKEQSGNASFSFGPTDAHSSKGSSFNFVPSNTGSSTETAFSFGVGNASEHVDKARQESETDATSFEDSADVKPSSFDDGDTESEETTLSESETSDEEESFLKLPASGQSGFKFGDVPTNRSTFTFGSDQPYEFGKPVNGTTGDNLFLNNKKPVDSDIVTSEDKDFSKDVPKLQDSNNILSQGTFTFSLDVPKQLTMTSPGNKDISGENPETEDERVVFKPIVSLPSGVDAKSGEEDEKTLFSSYAKLYSFTQNSWKERGVGELKVLYAPTRQRGRVIMRRDQVHALCANHFITKDMELKPRGSSGKSWLWYGRGDFAENEPNEQLFCIKFGDKKAAIAFKCAFEECIDHKVSVLSKDVVEDEVIVLYDVSVTEEQRARATKFLLPPNFYAYENKAPEAKQDDDKT